MVVVAPEKPQTIEPVVEPKTSEIGDTLRAAAVEIVERGWTQGTSVDHRGAICLLAAVSLAAGAELRPRLGIFDTSAFSVCRKARARGALTRHLPGPGIVSYNDAPGRTREEVLNMLKEVADLADTEGVS